MKRWLSLILIPVFGILIFAVGFIYDVEFAGIPYQDASQEMLATYDKNSLISNFLMISGVFITFLGLILKKEE